MSQRKIEPQIIDFRLIRKFGDHPLCHITEGKAKVKTIHAQIHGRGRLGDQTSSAQGSLMCPACLMNAD